MTTLSSAVIAVRNKAEFRFCVKNKTDLYKRMGRFFDHISFLLKIGMDAIMHATDSAAVIMTVHK